MLARPRAIVIIGVAGSGKTTLARRLALHYGDVFLDADDFHTPEARATMAAGMPLTDEQRVPWVFALERELCRQARDGRSTVLAFSGLRAAHRQRLRDSGVPMRFVFLEAAPTVIAARLARRMDHFLPSHLLASQLDAWQPPYAEPDVIVVDADCPLPLLLDRVIAALQAPAQ